MPTHWAKLFRASGAGWVAWRRLLERWSLGCRNSDKSGNSKVIVEREEFGGELMGEKILLTSDFRGGNYRTQGWALPFPAGLQRLCGVQSRVHRGNEWIEFDGDSQYVGGDGRPRFSTSW